MKFSNVCLLMFIVLLSSCNEAPLDMTSKKVFGLSTASGNYQNYELKIEKNDSLTKYTYHNQKSNLGNLSINYFEKGDSIASKYGNFTALSKTYTYRGALLKYYSTKKSGKAYSIIVFNKEYGIIATSTYGANFLFLKEKIAAEKGKNSFNEIVEILN